MELNQQVIQVAQLSQQCQVFVEVLAKCSGKSAKAWNRKEYDRALQWANYFEQVVNQLSEEEAGELDYTLGLNTNTSILSSRVCNSTVVLENTAIFFFANF